MSRWVLINEQDGSLYDVSKMNKTLLIWGASGLAKGEYETVEAAVAKFEAHTANVEQQYSLTFKVSV
jgi:hypothetical protein